MDSLNIFESKASLANFVKQLLCNPQNIASLINTPPENTELSEFSEIFMKNRNVINFLQQARHNPMMFLNLAETINEEHPIINEIFDSKPPKIYDENNKITLEYVQFCLKQSILTNDYYNSHQSDIDTIISRTNMPFNVAVDVYKQCDENLEMCLNILQSYSET